MLEVPWVPPPTAAKTGFGHSVPLLLLENTLLSFQYTWDMGGFCLLACFVEIEKFCDLQPKNFNIYLKRPLEI